MNTRQFALLSMLTALCVGIQLTPRPPNVEFTSLICFTVGAIFGIQAGAFLGGLTMFTNSFVSPWGFAGLITPFQMIGMVIIGIVGGIYGKSVKGNTSAHLTSIEAATLGAFLTLIYDVITNAACAPWYNWNVILALIMGTWFTILHVGSNTVLFGFMFSPLSKIVKRLYGG